MPTIARMPIKLSTNDRAAFFGTTGSGKTTLVKRLLIEEDVSFVALDPKRDLHIAGVPVRESYDRRKRQQIIVPPANLVGNPKLEQKFWDTAIDAAYWRGNTLIYVDELTVITPSTRLVGPIARAVRTGRSRGVGVWAGSQRPKDIPSAFFTEANHFFVFQLTWEEDRRKVVSFTHDGMKDLLSNMEGHDFAYYGRLGRRIVHFRQPSSSSNRRLALLPQAAISGGAS